ncbi:alkaline phosphatase, germ cell type [Trichonephila clavipes]|nr:alkaline phosphatase, germ cell type [Trichonephila clavipes]
MRFIAKQNSLMKIGNNGNLVLGPFDESTPCLMIVLMNCQTKLRINHLTAAKSVAILERGRIDHSHHFNNAHRALVDTLAFEDAVIAALEMTRSDDTLMVVTSDHSHVFAFGGYPKRGNPIFEKVAPQVEEDKSSNVLVSTSVRRVVEALDLPCSTVQKMMRNILRYYPYKLQFVQELLPHDFETRHLFSLQFLARLEVDPEWPWNILWTDEAHFDLDGSVNTHNCRIWETDNPHSTIQIPLHSPKGTVWCGLLASFILGPYFFKELGVGGPVTCSITGQRYASLLRNKIIPDQQARQCLSRIIFM